MFFSPPHKSPAWKMLLLAAFLLGFGGMARAGYYSTVPSSPSSSAPAPASAPSAPSASTPPAGGPHTIVPPAGGLHTIIVLPIDKCYAALGKKEAHDIEMHDANPYMTCLRRLQLKQAAARKENENEKAGAAAKKQPKKSNAPSQ